MTLEQEARQVVSSYQDALVSGDAQLARASLSSQLLMFNGNYSSEPSEFQAHLFLEGEELDSWLDAFIKEAGPHENQYQFLHSHVRANAAVVVTSDTGRNKFRSWEEEQVTWLLGRIEDKWRIVGMFIRDISNPGE